MKRIPTEGIVGLQALREAASSEFVQVMGLVRAALQAHFEAAKKPGESYVYFDIEAMYADRAIVCKDGRYWQFGYALDAENQVKLAAPVEVIERFDPVSMREAILIGPGGGARFAEAAQDGKVWDAVIVRAGKSENGNYYPDAVLREAVAAFEGAKVYVKSNDQHIRDARPDVRQLAGWIEGVKFVEGRAPDTGHLAARLHFSGFADLRETIVDAWRRGKKDLVGLSIDALGMSVAAGAQRLKEGVKRVARSILKVRSVDLIVDPSAGGALVRLVEAADPQEKDPMKDKMLAAIKSKFPQLDVSTLDDDAILVKYREAVAAEKKDDRQAGPAMTREELQEELRMVEARAAMRTRVNATTLPVPAKEALIARFEKLARFTEADVDAEIKAERAHVARLAEALGVDAGKVKLEGTADIEVEDRSEKIADMLDAFFDPAHKNHRAAQSFKECYIEITGDRRVTGRMENVDRSRLAEAVGATFREAVDTTAFANVLGTSLTRRMVEEYKAAVQYDIWKLVAGTPVPLADFRTQTRVRFGGYGDLPTVAEGAAYLGLTSPSDEAATYTPAKKGGTEDVTLEAIKNDDVGAIRRMPVRMARASKRTLAKFVLDFIRTNPTIYDSVAFFHASHGNLGSTALAAAEYSAARLAFLKQSEAGSSDRLGIEPRTLLVPFDLQETAYNLFQRSTNLDKTFLNSLVPTIAPVWYWTDTNDWALMADPNDIQTIEIGFLDGQEEPQLFVQDSPTVGSMFSNDKLTYKIRHIYGGNVVDYRGAYKEVVA